MNTQIPIPSFEDIRKTLQFWIDQQDKWFYFETEYIQTRSIGHEQTGMITTTFEDKWYTQTRIVGKIYDVVSFPPSLYHKDASVFTVERRFEPHNIRFIAHDQRPRYGLVFSQIIYFEPIEDIETFLKKDTRVAD